MNIFIDNNPSLAYMWFKSHKLHTRELELHKRESTRERVRVYSSFYLILTTNGRMMLLVWDILIGYIGWATSVGETPHFITWGGHRKINQLENQND